jgi:ferredoxin
VSASAGLALVVDWTACDGRGICMELLPELLEADPWGYPKGAGGSVPGAVATVPAELVPAAREAVHLCPLLALRLQG